MKNCFLSVEKRNIKNLIGDLSKVLGVDMEQLSFLEEKLDKIILNNKDNSLDDIINRYFSLLEKEMATLMTKKITAAMQFGIKNDYFTVIGYDGKDSSLISAKDITSKTYFSFDSISKILTSAITMLMIRDGKVSLNSTVNSFNADFEMDANIESILKFTAMIQTEKRIDNLSREETIEILKRCRDNIEEKNKVKNYYQYNDIGYMILRLSIPDFLDRLDTILKIADKDNLTYKNIDNKDRITGGKLGLEYVTPDTKGRGIPFPGHTGMYGNIEGLLNLYETLYFSDKILTKEEREILFKQPYDDPLIYNKDGSIALGKNNSYRCMSKVAGVYRMPNNIEDNNFSKIISCDISDLTTDKALASAGTCGSWVMGDDLSYQGKFGTYLGGILTNPYSYVKPGMYPENQNVISDTELTVTQRGVILGYPGKINSYKDVIARYGILLELLTEYIKNTELNVDLENRHVIAKKVKKLQ